MSSAIEPMVERSLARASSRRVMLFVLVCVSVGLLSGCSSLRNYILNVAGDATDVVRIDVGASAGTDMGAHAMVTKFVRLEAYSYEGTYRAGFIKRNVGAWREDRESWAFGPFGGGTTSATGHWFGSPRHVVDQRAPLLAESADEIGVGAHLFFAGFRLGVRPWQIVDLLAGAVGLDPAGDDLSWSRRQALRKQVEKSATKSP